MPSAPHRHVAKLLWAVTILYWFGLFGVTHIPAGRVPIVPISDKTQHLITYGALGGLLMASMWMTRPHATNVAVTVLAIGMIYGAIDEWTQALPFIRRDCSMLDWCADTSGLAIAVVVMTAVRAIGSRRNGATISRGDERPAA